ncbi:MAG: polysaccharide biosynthesis/export family protein [Opitutaceae bacterium]
MRGAALLAVAALLFTSCSSTPKSSGIPAEVPTDVQTLSEGDVIKIAFPGTPSMREDTQQIRRDGKINLTIIGEVKAADKSPSELEKELVTAYSQQLTSKEVKVTVVSSAFAVYVGGAVLKPGKIMPERALTALDAIMEAGGFDHTRANMKAVRVIRQEEGIVKNYYVNMKAVLEGADTKPFYLKSHDVVFVPEKISWF